MPIRRILVLLCIARLLCFPSSLLADDAKAPSTLAPSGPSESLAAYLAPDGTLALPKGFSGSLDPKGFQMATGADGTPRFVKSGRAGPKLFGVPGGCNDSVWAIAIAPSGLIYFGGNFSICEEVRAYGVVAYDPLTRRFQSLGEGADNGVGVSGFVFSMTIVGNDLYVGGIIQQAGGRPVNGIARWDGREWFSLGDVSGGRLSVYAIASSGNDIYVGGVFKFIGNLEVNNIARWNGSAWSALGTGANSGVLSSSVFRSVNALHFSGNDLYVGGKFELAGGQFAKNIARWNGNGWSALGQGISGEDENDRVRSLAFFRGELYAAGSFNMAGGQPANNIARWNGSTWSTLGSGSSNGVSSLVYTMAVAENEIYIGGFHLQAGGQPASRIARWNGTDWSALGQGATNGVNERVTSLAVSGSDLYVGGLFTSAGGQVVAKVAHWDGNTWNALGQGSGNGVNGPVLALAAIGSDLFVGGWFDRAGNLQANHIVRWNGSSWSALDDGTSNGVPSTVYSIVVSGGELYVAGGGVHRWDGSAWTTLGGGNVFALAVQGGNLFAGGQFTSIGGQSANHVARWDGNAWSPLGLGVAGGVQFTHVTSLVATDSDLYVGGDFTQAGGQAANHIARWDGRVWSPLGLGAANGVGRLPGRNDPLVQSMALLGAELYVGGWFTLAGGQPANYVARWNGNAWSALGSGEGNGVSWSVNVLAVFANVLYVGGLFTEAGGQAANGLARWVGNRWEGLATDDAPQEVFALASDGVSLFVGGSGLLQTPLPELQTRALGGRTGDAPSDSARISRSGGRTVFSSRASDLTAGGDNFSDIYLRDTTTREIVRVSQPTPTAKGLPHEEFFDPSIAPAGDTVAFSGTSGQVFANFGGLGRTASTSRGGTPGNGDSGRPMVPGAGSTVLLDTTSTNLLDTPDRNGPIRDIVAKDLNTGAVNLVTVGPTGQPANGDSFGPWATDDGQTVAFWSLATNLSDESVNSGDAAKIGTIKQAMVNGTDGLGRSATYVSRNMTTSALGNGDSINVRLTPDGRFGVFESVASNLVDDDTNGVSDIFRFELERVGSRLQLVNLERVSLSRFGFQGNGPSYNASISDDGQFITFQTDATNLIELDRNGATDILVKWMVTKEVVRLSRTVDGEQPNGDSIEPSISGDGSTIVFGSGATNLTENDDNGVDDIFAVRIRESGDSPAIIAPLDEPTLQQVALTPNPPNASCPAGFYIATVEDGPGPGVSNGAFGMELLLDQPGTRVLAGGLNFGGLVDVSQRGFAAVNIANAANENQRLNVSLTGTSNPSGTLPARLIIERRSGGSAVQIFQTDVTLNATQPFVTSIVVPPGFYVASVTPQGFAPEAAGGEPEGRFLFSLTTSFVDRPGGGFQGGAVVGGYHATNPFGGSSGFAAFCLATPHTVSAKVLSAPTYGASGARDLRLSVLDQARNEIAASPVSGGN
jgi:hypothetical protein